MPDRGRCLVTVAVGPRRTGPGRASSIEVLKAALALDPWFVPVDHSIIGIVDSVDLLEED